ncbi:hypothetical protein H8E88_22285 [candidate division KSB1 bacterium]|nr:hypothetical protein [candidate division KSB1 bacterium]
MKNKSAKVLNIDSSKLISSNGINNSNIEICETIQWNEKRFDVFIDKLFYEIYHNSSAMHFGCVDNIILEIDELMIL